MNDLISKIEAKEALRVLKETAWLGTEKDLEKVEKAQATLEKLIQQTTEEPLPYKQKRETGRWIVYEVANTEEEQPIAWRCNNCEEVVSTKWNFCPNCGARMVDEDERPN